jgi:hypothetical protein
MAVPRLAEDPPFYELDPGRLPVPPGEAASREGAVKVARRVGPGQMRPVEMVVCGSVAVNRDGTRLGKGAGSAPSSAAGREEQVGIRLGVPHLVPCNHRRVLRQPEQRQRRPRGRRVPAGRDSPPHSGVGERRQQLSAAP